MSGKGPGDRKGRMRGMYPTDDPTTVPTLADHVSRTSSHFAIWDPSRHEAKHPKVRISQSICSRNGMKENTAGLLR